MAIGAGPALVVALAAPQAWLAAAGWVLVAAALIVVDLALAVSPRALEVSVTAPKVMGVGRLGALGVEARFKTAAPRTLELAVAGDERLQVHPVRQGLTPDGAQIGATLTLKPHRRGEARLGGLWLRWGGPLGLIWRQRTETHDAPIAVTPDIEGVKEQALKLFSRDAPFGEKAQLDLGEGAEFHALKEFQTGMDQRAVDWKQSARHGKLVGREYRAERNHNVILALDCGRLMSAPVAGEPRIDRAINAALLLAFTSLKLGDRVGLFAFDSRPRVSSGVTAGASAFGLLQRLAASIDYSTEETNFTLALTQLGGQLKRRALVVVFTDFADATSAELMVENLSRLTRTHLVLFVVFRDEELEALVTAEPKVADDVSRAVIAQALARQRDGVLTRLRRMGVQIVDAPVAELGPALVNSYFDIKRRELV
ncbi:MAG: DUF58 domain-containing protein [Phenylobacterium sp.]|nr:MAG: DUF58 domain-containing protein [Phenylobacterium sp.]